MNSVKLLKNTGKSNQPSLVNIVKLKPDSFGSSDEFVVIFINQGLHIGIKTLQKINIK